MKTLLLFVILLVGSCFDAIGQINFEKGYKPQPLGKDTLCFSYKLYSQDTLVYHKDAIDSISIDGMPLLVKHRVEEWLYICDSVDADGYAWTQQYLTRIVEHQKSEGDSVVRTTSPWIGRRSYRVIDTLGNTKFAWSDTTRGTSVNPGGPVVPLFLPRFGSQGCGRQNESWSLVDTVLCVEGGYPEAAEKRTTLWRVLDKAKNDGKTYRQIQHTTTSIARFDVSGDGTDMSTYYTNNGYGKLSFRNGLDVPYHFFSLSQNKAKLDFKNGVKKEGKHTYYQDVQLIEIRSPKKSRRVKGLYQDFFEALRKGRK